MFKRFLALVLFITTLTTLIFPKSVSAQAPWWRPSIEEFNAKVEGGSPNEIFGERYTHAQVYWVVYSLMNLLSDPEISKCAGLTGDDLKKCLGIASGPTTQYFAHTSPLLQVAALIDIVRNTKPASGIEYIASSLQKFHIVPEAYAQGFGYNTLRPVQVIWRLARNTAYGLMILVILILAFMIMFRARISPQVVITIQSALPKIAVALILIAFSYAIAGLLIDLAFLAIGLFAAVINQPSILTAGWSTSSIFEKLNNPVMGTFALVYAVLIALFALAVIASLIISALTLGSGFAVAMPISVIIGIIIVVVLLIGLVRLFWLLLREYVIVLMLIIISPFYILFGTLPLQIAGIGGGGFGSWIKVVIAHLSTFVMTGILVFFAHFFFWSGQGAGFLGTPWNFISTWQVVNPYQINTTLLANDTITLPAFVGVSYATIAFFVGIAVLLATPTMATVVRNALLGLRGPEFGAAVGASLSVPAALGGYYVGRKTTAYEDALRLATTASAQASIRRQQLPWIILSEILRRVSGR